MTWTPPPALVERVCAVYHKYDWPSMPEDETAQRIHNAQDRFLRAITHKEFERERMSAAIAASTLGDAIGLLERIVTGSKGWRDQAAACNEARALLASLDATEGTKS